MWWVPCALCETARHGPSCLALPRGPGAGSLGELEGKSGSSCVLRLLLLAWLLGSLSLRVTPAAGCCRLALMAPDRLSQASPPWEFCDESWGPLGLLWVSVWGVMAWHPYPCLGAMRTLV